MGKFKKFNVISQNSIKKLNYICTELIKKDGGMGPMMSWQPLEDGAKSHSTIVEEDERNSSNFLKSFLISY